MRAFAIALAGLAPLCAFGQHQGHTMPMPSKPAVKKQATKKTAVKKKVVKKQAAKKATKRSAAPAATKKGAASPHQGHQGMGQGATKAPEAQPAGHEGHGGAPVKAAPTAQPQHQGHGVTATPPSGTGTTNADPNQGHGGATPPAGAGTGAPIQHQGHDMTPPAGQQPAGTFKLPPPGTQPNLNKQGWPSPVMDSETYSFNLFERLEYLPSGGGGGLTWDFVGWRGGDYHRIWYKTEGDQGFQSDGSGEGDIEIHYGRLVAPFFDLLTGVRVEQQWGDRSRTRFSIGAGLQGLSPYIFDTEAFVFLSQNGRLSFNGNAARDLYLTQRFAVQPRIETNLSLQSDRDFGVGAGLNDLELGVRLRYEIRREFAPYVGVTWQQQFGETASLSRARGDDTSRFRIVLGVRLWF